MKRPFIIIRFVFFSISFYLNLLGLAFAAWNISSTRAVPMEVEGAAIFIIFNACATFCLVALALAEMAYPMATTATVIFESSWTAVMSILEIAAAVDATVNGPPTMCRAGVPWKVCASSTVLVPISWLSSVFAIGYCLALLGTAVHHLDEYPNLLVCSIYSIPWFSERTSPAAPVLPSVPLTAKSFRDSIMRSTSRRGDLTFPTDVEANPPRPSHRNGQYEPTFDAADSIWGEEGEKPLPPVQRRPTPRSTSSTRDGGNLPWWQRQSVFRPRPGKDAPFTLKPKPKQELKKVQTPAPAPVTYPTPIANAHQSGWWSKKILPGEDRDTRFTSSYYLNPDEPIPHGSREQWKTADHDVWHASPSEPYYNPLDGYYEVERKDRRAAERRV